MHNSSLQLRTNRFEKRKNVLSDKKQNKKNSRTEMHKERGYKKASLFLLDNRQIDSIMIVKKLTRYNNNKNNKK